MTLEELKEVYIKDMERRGVEIMTIKSKKSHIRLLFSYLKRNGITNENHISRKIVIDFCGYLTFLENEEGKIKYNVNYRCLVLSTLRDFLNAVYRLGYIPVDLAVWIENPKSVKRITKNIFTVKEIRIFFEKMRIKTVYDFTIKVICILLYGTGIRIGEAIKLKVEDVNFADYEIKIMDGKAKRERLAVFGDVVKDYLEIYLKYFRPKLARGKNTNRFFIPVSGNNICNEAIGRHILRFCKDAGIEKKITSHCFRHSYCSHLLSNGLGIREISELVGHKHFDITAGYARIKNDDLVDVIKRNHPRERNKEKILGVKNGTDG